MSGREHLQEWFDKNLDDQIRMLNRLDKGSANVITLLREVDKLQSINRGLDERLHPPRFIGRVDIFTELKEIN